MTLQFGLYVSFFGMLIVFSALGIVAAVGEGLKRIFKQKTSEKGQIEEQIPKETSEMNEEILEAVSLIATSYIYATSYNQLFLRSERSAVESSTWTMVGRMSI